ncbi:MAG: glycosyltransferase family 4 protein [Bacteroidota bacterium]|nr:glycosyltransferase family 4 protein [Bacteroidota bacterium]
MKVLLVGKSAKIGGAAIASYRLMEILRKNGVSVKMLVQEESDEDAGVFSTTRTSIKKWINFMRFAWERMLFFRHEKSKEVRFVFSLANTGESLKRNRLIREADIIHLHWINAGFLSLKSIRELLDLGKPVVWTFHDMWPITGGCHHALSCPGYKQDCGECIYLKKPGKHDLSHRLWKKKSRIFKDRNIAVVTPSNWLRDRVRESSLFGQMNVRAIHNPVDQTQFRPVDRGLACRNFGLDPSKRYILFGAASVRNLYKGFTYFLEALKQLSQNPEETDSVEIILFGKTGGEVSHMFPMKVHSFDYINSVEDMVELYSIAHMYVISSLQDTFPTTIMESMLCGTPVVGFRTGGIPEMIEHFEDGYLAEHKSATDLAEGIRWILSYDPYAKLTELARKAAVRRFSMEALAEKHVELYKRLLNRSQA